MLGTNKTWDTQRIDAGSNTYQTNLTGIRFRYEPVYGKNYVTKSQHITFTLFCDRYDIKVADRIIHGDRKFVVAGVPDFTDALGQHFEILMREVESDFHEDVVRKTLSPTQTNIDPIFNEWSGAKSYIDTTISVLIDPIESAKNAYINIIDPGKLEQVDYLMTVDYPLNITKSERIIRRGTEYEVMWIIEHPFQYLVWLKKSMLNYT